MILAAAWPELNSIPIQLKNLIQQQMRVNNSSTDPSFTNLDSIVRVNDNPKL